MGRSWQGALQRRRVCFVDIVQGSCLQGMMQLKHQLKKDDVVVLIFHDHGSRYVGQSIQ
jgi:cystathionine beta-synthase